MEAIREHYDTIIEAELIKQQHEKLTANLPLLTTYSSIVTKRFFSLYEKANVTNRGLLLDNISSESDLIVCMMFLTKEN